MLAALSLFALSLLPTAPASPRAEPEIVIMVLFDATRADHLGAYGYGRPTSPTIDRLAAGGRRFSRAFSNAPWTRPSTTSFLTGLNTSRHHTETDDSKLPANVRTVAERLGAAGWHTAGFTANGHAGSMAGLQRGFDVFEDPTRTYVRGSRGTPYLNGLPTGPFLVEHALAHLRQDKHDKVFLYLFLVDAHDPYEAPPALEKMFLGDFSGTIRRRAVWEPKEDYPAAERFSMMAVYDAGIRAADAALGTFLAGVADLQRYKKTTVVVSADHGEGFGEHHFYLHAHHFWNEVIHIPLVVSGPGWAQGVDDRLADSLDVARTLVQAGGGDVRDMPGHDLRAPAAADKTIVSEYNEYGIHRQAILGGSQKVIWQRPADEAWFMRTAKNKAFFPSVVFDRETVVAYDLAADPKEQQPQALPLPPPAAGLLQRLRAFVAGAPRR